MACGVGAANRSVWQGPVLTAVVAAVQANITDIIGFRFANEVGVNTLGVGCAHSQTAATIYACRISGAVPTGILKGPCKPRVCRNKKLTTDERRVVLEQIKRLGTARFLFDIVSFLGVELRPGLGGVGTAVQAFVSSSQHNIGVVGQYINFIDIQTRTRQGIDPSLGAVGTEKNAFVAASQDEIGVVWMHFYGSYTRAKIDGFGNELPIEPTISAFINFARFGATITSVGLASALIKTVHICLARTLREAFLVIGNRANDGPVGSFVLLLLLFEIHLIG